MYSKSRRSGRFSVQSPLFLSLSLPEELISWEFDSQAIIATGTLLTNPGQVVGRKAEYWHGGGRATSALNKFQTSLRGRFWQCELFFEAQKKIKVEINIFYFFQTFWSSAPVFGSNTVQNSGVICVARFHMELGTFNPERWLDSPHQAAQRKWA